jgi:hypothetical protein
MKRTHVGGFTLVIVLAVSTPLSAKGTTTRITIEGGDLAAPVVLADPIVLQQFNVWAGRGTRMNGVEGNDGFIIDWRAGAVSDPAGGPEYTVSFFVTRNGNEQLAYKVVYRRDRSGGFVYLPGSGHEWYRLNVRAIFRGCEGRWFRATTAWEQAVDRVIASNTARR